MSSLFAEVTVDPRLGLAPKTLNKPTARVDRDFGEDALKPKSPLKLLCVDQDKGCLRFLLDLLSKCGYRALPAATLRAALKSLAKTSVDAIILSVDSSDWRTAVSSLRYRMPRAAILLYGRIDEPLHKVLEVADGIVSKPDIAGLLVLLTAVAAEVAEQRQMLSRDQKKVNSTPQWHFCRPRP